MEGLERLIHVGYWFAGKPTGRALRSEDLGSPVPALIDLAERVRRDYPARGLLTNVWITPAGITLKYHNAQREFYAIPQIALDGLMNAVARQGNEQAPNMAEAPVVVWTETHGDDGITRVVRLTVERAGSIILRVSVRYNYAIPLEMTLAPPADKCLAALKETADFIVSERPRVLVVGPSGSGKTTVVQALMGLLLERNPYLCLTYLGRFWDPVVFPTPTVMWGPGQDIAMPVSPVVAVHTQARFVGGLSSLTAAADQGLTRSEPDLVIQDELLSTEDAVLAVHAATTGAGYISTAHMNLKWDDWGKRLEALTAENPTLLRLVAPEVVIEVARGKVVRIWCLSQELFSS